MTRPRPATRHIRDERGAVLPWVAISITVLLLFVAFVIDVANWFEHRRHLQTQADAAALAGGTAWGTFPCAPGSPSETNMEGIARDYAGPHTVEADGQGDPTAPHNAQVGGTPPERMHVLINSKNFYNEGGTNHSDGSPCEKGYLDIKITETDLPWFFPLAGKLVPAINAHARVSILKANSLHGLLPLYVRDINPESAAVIFMRENADGTKTKIAAEYLSKAPATLCQSGLHRWNSPPTTVMIDAPKISALVAVSSVKRCTESSSPCLSLAPSLTVEQICSQVATECFWADGNPLTVREGLVFIRGYDAGVPGTKAAPVLRQATIDPGGGAPCNGASFVFTTTSCTVLVRARIDMGGFETEVGQAGNQQVKLTGGACGATGCLMTLAPDGLWQAPLSVSPPPERGPWAIPLGISWAYKNTTVGVVACTADFASAPAECKGSFPMAQRVFTGSDGQFGTSGPVRTMTIKELGSATMFSSGAIGATHTLEVSVHLAGAVATQSAEGANEPAIRLRVVAEDRNKVAIDCEQNGPYPPETPDFRLEITLGCQPGYKKNLRLSAPDPCNPPWSGATGRARMLSLWSSPNPPAWDCVAAHTGGSIGQLQWGLWGRVMRGGVPCTGDGNDGCRTGEGCPPGVAIGQSRRGRNYWNAPGEGWGYGSVNGLPPGDTRIVTLFMLPYGAFKTPGEDIAPIKEFGAFYITDWTGDAPQRNDPCGTEPEGSLPMGYVAGHFITYTLPFTSDGTGTCGGGTTDPCVAVLTE